MSGWRFLKLKIRPSEYSISSFPWCSHNNECSIQYARVTVNSQAPPTPWNYQCRIWCYLYICAYTYIHIYIYIYTMSGYCHAWNTTTACITASYNQFVINILVPILRPVFNYGQNVTVSKMTVMQGLQSEFLGPGSNPCPSVMDVSCMTLPNYPRRQLGSFSLPKVTENGHTPCFFYEMFYTSLLRRHYSGVYIYIYIYTHTHTHTHNV